MLIVAIPLVLVIVGMILNSIGLSFDQPPSSSEQIQPRGGGRRKLIAVSLIYRESEL
jgi:hypothetical protein